MATAEIAGGWFDKALAAYSAVAVAKINAGFAGAKDAQVIGSATIPDADKTGVNTYDIKTAVGTQVRPLVGDQAPAGVMGMSPLVTVLLIVAVVGIGYAVLS